MKIIKKVFLSAFIITIFCVAYKVIFNVDLWNIFIFPLIKETVSTIFSANI